MHWIIELDDGKIYRKALYLMVKNVVSCRFSLKPIIQWLESLEQVFLRCIRLIISTYVPLPPRSLKSGTQKFSWFSFPTIPRYTMQCQLHRPGREIRKLSAIMSWSAATTAASMTSWPWRTWKKSLGNPKFLALKDDFPMKKRPLFCWVPCWIQTACTWGNMVLVEVCISVWLCCLSVVICCLCLHLAWICIQRDVGFMLEIQMWLENHSLVKDTVASVYSPVIKHCNGQIILHLKMFFSLTHENF